MATYIGVHEVDDVDHWLRSPKRQELFGRMGITGQLFTDTAKSNRVGLILEIPDMEAFQQLLQSQAGARRDEVRWCPSRNDRDLRKGIRPRVKACGHGLAETLAQARIPAGRDHRHDCPRHRARPPVAR